MATMGKKLSTYPVYSGPAASGYTQVGSVGSSEVVTFFWEETSGGKKWCYIGYDVVSTGKKKCGYVLDEYVNHSGEQPLAVRASDPGVRYAKTGGTTYTGPGSGYETAGSVSTNEQVTYQGYKLSGYALIEYSVTGTSNKKRAWFYANNLVVKPSHPIPEGYRTFIQNQKIPSNFPMGGATVTQGWNDKTTNRKGHLGYDMGGFTDVKPLFFGTVEDICDDIGGPNGRVICLKHTEGDLIFYSAYCHLKSIAVKKGQKVWPTTTLGQMGGSGNGYEGGDDPAAYPVHLHVCVFTGGATTNPSGYCDPSHYKRFEDVSEAFQGEAGGYYYGSEKEKFPRCGGLRFYDPYGVVTSNMKVIQLYQ